MSILGVYGILQVGMLALGLMFMLGSANMPEKEKARTGWSSLDTLVDLFFFVGLFIYICWRGDETVTYHEGMVFVFITVTQIFNIRMRALNEAMKNV
jgi:NhaP-type Na+/H+ or K+/H+ antiporter